MHSQLEENTRLSELMLKDVVTNNDVCDLLDEIWEQYIETSKKLGKDINTLKNPYTKIKEKLTNNIELDKEELDTVLEILRNIDKLFRTYGKKANGFGSYLTQTIKKRRSLQ